MKKPQKYYFIFNKENYQFTLITGSYPPLSDFENTQLKFESLKKEFKRENGYESTEGYEVIGLQALEAWINTQKSTEKLQKLIAEIKDYKKIMVGSGELNFE